MTHKLITDEMLIKAERISKHLADGPWDRDDIYYVLEAVADDIVEACAKVAENYPSTIYRDHRHLIAGGIRSLKAKP